MYFKMLSKTSLNLNSIWFVKTGRLKVFLTRGLKETWNQLDSFVAIKGLSWNSKRHRSQDWETSGEWRLPCVKLKVFVERLGRDPLIGKYFTSITINILCVFDQRMRDWQRQNHIQLPIFTTWPRRFSPPPLFCGLNKIPWANRADWLQPPFHPFYKKLCISSLMWEGRL